MDLSNLSAYVEVFFGSDDRDDHHETRSGIHDSQLRAAKWTSTWRSFRHGFLSQIESSGRYDTGYGEVRPKTRLESLLFGVTM